jgi:hypothetical protein
MYILLDQRDECLFSFIGRTQSLLPRPVPIRLTLLKGRQAPLHARRSKRRNKTPVALAAAMHLK